MNRPRPSRLNLCALEARDNPSSLPTVQISNINWVSGPDDLTPVGNTLYFMADDGVHGRQLWRTNGQVGDAVPVEGEAQGLNSPPHDSLPLGGRNWAVSGSWLYYLTDDNGTITLRRNDSSASPTNGISPSESVVITGATDDPDGNGPWGVVAVGHDLYFGAYEPADANWHLWKVTGADAPGTAIPTVTPFDYPGMDSNGLYDVAAAGSNLYFTADAPGTTNIVVWASDGTLNGTAPVADGQGGYLSGRFSGNNIAAFGGALYGIFDGTLLWRINGPGATADRIGDVGRTPDGLDLNAGANLPPDYHMTPAGDSIYFVTNRPGGGGADSYFVWNCTGTTAEQIWHPTYPDETPQPISDFASGPLQLVSAGSGVYVSDETVSLTGQFRLWKLDGTPGGATLLEASRNSSETGLPSPPAGLTVAGTSLYYWDLFGQLALSQGTAATTYPTDIQGSTDWDEFDAAYNPQQRIAAIGSTLYFTLPVGSTRDDDPGQARTLWRTDPFSQAGTQAALDGPLPTDSTTGDPTVTLDGTTQAQADSFLALFDPNAPGFTPLQPPAGATTPTDIVVNFDPSIQINEANLVIPQGIRVRINGGTWHGGTPALTLSSGDLTITGATFVNDTPAATILVNGGNLTLRDCTIEESTGAPEPAIEVDAGTIDLGRTDDPGGNILNVNGAGTLIDNETAASIIAFGNHWTADGDPAPPGTVIAGFVEWGEAPNVDIVGGVFVLDDQPHPAAATVTGAGGVSLGSPTITYVYQDGDGNWVSTANGGTAPPFDPGYYRATASFEGTDDYQSATATADITIAYAVKSLTDLSAAFKAGRTIPIKLQLLDADGINVSSAAIAVAALRLERINADGTRTILPVTASGNANPANLFRYDATLGGYIFNLSTKDLSAGTYDFVWIAGDDPTEHKLEFSLN